MKRRVTIILCVIAAVMSTVVPETAAADELAAEPNARAAAAEPSAAAIPPAAAVEIHLADFNIYRDSENAALTDADRAFNRTLGALFEREGFGSRFVVRRLGSIDRFSSVVPKSTLDAAEICEQAGIDYLLYGSLRKTDSYYDAELRVFDRERNEIRKTVYSKEGADDLSAVADGLVRKTSAYFREMFGIRTGGAASGSDYSGMMIRTGVGYFLPYGDWFNVMNPLFALDGAFFIAPIVKIDGVSLSFFRFGISLSYALALNRAEYETGFYHPVCIGLPCEAFFEFLPQHVVSAGIAPRWEMNLLVQDRLYNDPLVSFLSAFGVSIPLGYEYRFDPDTSIGIVISTDVSFHEPVLVKNRFELSMMFRLSSFKGAVQ